MKRSDYLAIQTACEAFSASHQSHNGGPYWPGTKHMENAIDAYNRVNAQPAAALEQMRKDWREEMGREYAKLIQERKAFEAAVKAAKEEPPLLVVDALKRIAVALEQINKYGIKADS